jgi:sec-independent protein translocase protein TatA
MGEGLFQPLHLLIIAFIALIVFGPKRLPELGKGMGEAIRGFKQSMREGGEEAEKEATPTPKPKE